MAHSVVSVLRGGNSPTYDLSILAGGEILSSLPDNVRAQDIFIDRKGIWHKNGLPVSEMGALSDTDLVWNSLYGSEGEDGAIQSLLDNLQIKYVGTGVLPAKISIDKARTRAVIGSLEDVRMPPSISLHKEDFSGDANFASQEVFSKFGPPYIVKPLRGGLSIGIHYASDIVELIEAIALAWIANDAVVVDRFIEGREATIGTARGLRGEEIYVFPAIELRLGNQNKFLDYYSKKNNEFSIEYPGVFSADEVEALQNSAREIHSRLNLGHFARLDFIVAPSGIYFIEVNTQPDFRAGTPMRASMDAVGLSLQQFLVHNLGM